MIYRRFCIINIGTLRSTTRQVRQRCPQNVKMQCEFKYYKEAIVNWLLYLMFQACFMTSTTLQFC